MQDFFNKDIENEYDLVVLGAGPAGLTAGMYASRDKLKTLIIEKQFPGGQVAITEFVENYPGIPEGLMGADLTEKFYEHAAKFGVQIRNAECEKIEVDGDYKLIYIKNREIPIRAKAVIAAFGSKPKPLDVPGENKFYGRGISFCATCDGSFYKDREIAVIGGGDSAVEEGLYLTKFASKVTIVHRRDELRASKIVQDRAFANPKVEFAWNKVVKSVNGTMKIDSITLEDTKTGETSDLEIAGVFVFIGWAAYTELIKDLVDIDDWGFAVAGEDTKTKTPGLFVAGDVRTKPLRQISTAVCDGSVAAKEAQKYISEHFTD